MRVEKKIRKKQKTKKTRFDKTLSTDAHDWSQIFSCAYMTYTLLAHVQSQDCSLTVKLIQKFSLQYKDSQQAGVKHSLLLEQPWLSHMQLSIVDVASVLTAIHTTSSSSSSSSSSSRFGSVYHLAFNNSKIDLLKSPVKIWPTYFVSILGVCPSMTMNSSRR